MIARTRISFDGIGKTASRAAVKSHSDLDLLSIFPTLIFPSLETTDSLRALFLATSRRLQQSCGS
jgi:hypothetical protein